MNITVTEPSKAVIPKATFSITVDDGKREVIIVGEVNLLATIREDNHANVQRALEQALYAAFFTRCVFDGANGKAPGNDQSTRVA